MRLFVALELPGAVRATLAAWGAAQLGGAPGVRLVDARSLHVTLCFLGGRDPGEVGEITAAYRAGAPPEAFPLSLGEALRLPPRRPRVIAVELGDPSGGLARLQGRLAAALAEGGFYEPERRPYLGHVTVARVSRRLSSSHALPPPDPLDFMAQAVTLFQSRLERGGARYEALDTIALSAQR